MSDANDPGNRNVALVVQSLNPDERSLLRNWAYQVILIRSSNLSSLAKLLRIATITRELGMTGPLLRIIGDEIMRIGWKDRSKAMRGAIGGAGIGLVASVGAPMAGVAAFGGAIAVPVLLLGAGAGALLMAIVEEIDKK